VRWGITILFALLQGNCASAADTFAKDAHAGQPQQGSPVAERFQAIKSEHFTIYTDADIRLARRLASRLEATYEDVLRFCRRNKFPILAPNHSLEVIFFEHPEDYHDYAATVNYQSGGTLGFFHADTNRSVFFNSQNDPRLIKVRGQIDQARKKLDRREVARLQGLLRMYESQVNQMVIQHEAAHMVLYNLGVHSSGASSPPWLVEGLALLFEPAPTDRGSGIRSTNEFRLFDFREALRDGREIDKLSPADFHRAVEAGIMVDLRTLVSDPQIWQAQGPVANNYYAEAWALAHYLQRTRREPWGEYLRTLASRKPGRDSSPAQELRLFEELIGPLDDKFTDRWAAYILRLPAPKVLAKIH
jgi:hypothetical protein